MAQLLSFLLLSTILTAAAIPAVVTATRTGLTLNLIDRFSPASPFYSGNLTKSQLAQKLLEQSRRRISYIKHSIHMHNDQSNITTIRPPVTRADSGVYLASVSIGTGDAKQSYYLVMDTGSSLTWTQCAPCNPCFTQRSPTLHPRLSPSFAFLPCTDPLCAEPYVCRNNWCTYTVSYADGASVAGIISRDAFTFETSTGNPEIVQGLAFGCTHGSSDLVGFDGDVDGVMGLDASPISLVTQLGPRSGGRFSYCFLPFGATTDNYLRFGDDITMNGPVQRTRIETRSGFYYLDVNGLSIQGQHLNIPPGTFDPHVDGSGGCIIDSGAGMTHMIKPAYVIVKDVMVDYFNSLGLEPVDGSVHGLYFDVCYHMPQGFDRFPSMIFHFSGADWTVEGEALFFVDDESEVPVFCLMMEAMEEMTIIGAYQQYNTRFTYDLVSRELLFVPEDCSLHG